MTDTDRDLMHVREGQQRRRFIRRGAAFVLAGGLAGQQRALHADDCDRARAQGGSEGDKRQVAGSDSDAGAEADPAGCGRRRSDAPKISRSEPLEPAVYPGVARIKG